MQEIFLYNTLTHRKEALAPLRPAHIGLYTCGPTVYNYAHIGNFRTFVFEDFLRRALEFFGFSVTHVMNITDVGHLVSDADEGEDKVELEASRQSKSAREIAQFYTRAFFEDAEALALCRPHQVPRATDHIPEMLALIRRMEQGGYTYRTEDGVYFDTSRFPRYGALHPTSLSGQRPGARVEPDPKKKNPQDFALWKFSPKSPKRQMEWDSPWGRGFPGWHIECSAMSMKYLGESFDIHCGGADHTPIHHTNEIAQSEAATGRSPFVRFWLHGEFLVFGPKMKMAKSAGEFITVRTLREKDLDPLSLRYLYATAHYRTPLEFSWDSLEAAQKALQTLRGHLQSWMEEPQAGPQRRVEPALPDRSRVPQAETSLGQDFRQRFWQAVSDDLNVPQALAICWELVRSASGVSPAEKRACLLEFDRLLGFRLGQPEPVTPLPEALEDLLRRREEARVKRDFKLADALRRELSQKGVILEDTPQGTRWKYKQRRTH